MSTLTITMQHVMGARLCSRGARQWFTAHGLDYAKFLREGLPVEQVEALNDALAKRVVEYARKMEASNGE